MNEANTYTIPNGFREVTREEFFRTVGNENVIPVPCGRYPYYNEWRTPNGYVRGWSHAGTYAVRQDGKTASSQ